MFRTVERLKDHYPKNLDRLQLSLSLGPWQPGRCLVGLGGGALRQVISIWEKGGLGRLSSKYQTPTESVCHLGPQEEVTMRRRICISINKLKQQAACHSACVFLTHFRLKMDIPRRHRDASLLHKLPSCVASLAFSLLGVAFVTRYNDLTSRGCFCYAL